MWKLSSISISIACTVGSVQFFREHAKGSTHFCFQWIWGFEPRGLAPQLIVFYHCCIQATQMSTIIGNLLSFHDATFYFLLRSECQTLVSHIINGKLILVWSKLMKYPRCYNFGVSHHERVIFSCLFDALAYYCFQSFA